MKGYRWGTYRAKSKLILVPNGIHKCNTIASAMTNNLLRQLEPNFVFGRKGSYN